MPTRTEFDSGFDSGFDPGLDLRIVPESLRFEYGVAVFGPTPEMRRLDAIRPSLLDPNCAGPDPVYGIAMDVGREQDLPELSRNACCSSAR